MKDNREQRYIFRNVLQTTKKAEWTEEMTVASWVLHCWEFCCPSSLPETHLIDPQAIYKL